jgi:hypothetical protein
LLVAQPIPVQEPSTTLMTPRIRGSQRLADRLYHLACTTAD